MPDGPALVEATAFDADGNTTHRDARAALRQHQARARARRAPTRRASAPARRRPGSSTPRTTAAAYRARGLQRAADEHRPPFRHLHDAKDFVLSGQAEGFWTFTVRAADAAGNFAQQSRDIKIDGTAPETTIVSGPDDGDALLTWDLEANENATFECRIVPAQFAPARAGRQHR